MRETESIMKKTATIFAIVLMVAMVGFMGCAGGGAGNTVPNEDKANAKIVVKAASNVLATTESLDLTEKDSPAIIDQNDPKYANFFKELQDYKTMVDLELTNCSLKVSIQSVTASTARGDSAQTNYRYSIIGVNMNVNGVGISYDASKGFTTQ